MVAAVPDPVKSLGVAAALPAAVAGLVFWLGLDGGSYSVESRATFAIALWWTVLIAVVLGLWPLVEPPRAAIVTAVLLAGLTVWAGLSVVWAESDERAFGEFNRVALYLGVFLVAVLAGVRGNVVRTTNGIAIGIAAVGLLALASRLFPDTLPSGDVPEFLPSASSRLSWPVEYWNGLAILVGLSFPLLLRVAAAGRGAAWRGLAVGVIPALVATMYLTSSRGGFATAFVGMAAFLVMTPRRWAAGCAAAVAGAGSVLAVAALLSRDALVNEPLERASAAAAEGRSAALLILLACLGAGLVYGLGVRFLSQRLRPPVLAGRVAGALVVIAVLAALVASNPVDRFEQFKTPPTQPIANAENDFIRAHLLSGHGSGRWQFWAAAIDQFEEHPFVGDGAGTYEAWWARNAPFTYFLRDAHSLYLETLGELGLVGLVLLGGAVAVGTSAGVRRLLDAQGDERGTIAALLAAFLGFGFAAGIDWMWELTVVSVVGFALLGLLTGPATATTQKPRLLRRPGKGRRKRARLVGGITVALIGWILICAQAIPFLSSIKISDSHAAARRGDVDSARSHAGAARQLQPWAASPYLQLALVEERIANLDQAEVYIRDAIDRDPLDWRLWLVAARIETAAGEIAAARRSLTRAAELNPRSPLFANVR